MRKARLEYGITHIDDDAVDPKDIDPLIMKGKLNKGGFEPYVGNRDDYDAAGGKYKTNLTTLKKDGLIGILFFAVMILLIWLITK